MEIAWKHLQTAQEHQRRIKTEYGQFFGLNGQRRSHYLYAVFPGAVEAVEEEVRRVEEEMDFLLLEREKYRTHRAQMRWLLDKGRRAEDVRGQMEEVLKHPEFPAADERFFIDTMGYLMFTKRLFRVSEVALEGLAGHGTPDEVGAAFSVLVNELLEKHQGPRVPFDPDLDRVSTRLVKLLERIMAVRGEGRPIVLTDKAIEQLMYAVPVDLCLSTFWTLLKAQGNDPNQIGATTGLRFCDRLCRPESGTSRWKEAWEIVQVFDGYESLKFPENRTILSRILHYALLAEDHPTTDKILDFITRETNFDPLKGRRDKHDYEMASALRDNDEPRLLAAFSELIKSGEEATAHSLSILHAFYKRNDNEIERRNIMEQAMKLYRPSMHLLAQMLHDMVLAGASYPEIFRVYRQHFHTAILRRFSISLDAQLDPLLNSPDELKKRTPDHVILTIMIQAYCYNAPVHRIWELYNRYHSYIHGHRRLIDGPIFHKLIHGGTYTPHVFMMALSKYREGLPYVTYILEDMLRPKARIQADVYTWSIFIRALMFNDMAEPAERVITQMKEYGIQPNVVTWTSLLATYQRASAPPEMSEPVLEQMSLDGITPNAVTWKTVIHMWANAEEKNPWKVGDAFRKMIEAGYEPDDMVLEDVAPFQDDVRFVAGVSGESEVAEGVFEDGTVTYPMVRTREEVEREWKVDREKEEARMREAERVALRMEEERREREREEEEGKRRREREDVFETGELSWPEPGRVNELAELEPVKEGIRIVRTFIPNTRVEETDRVADATPKRERETFFEWKIQNQNQFRIREVKGSLKKEVDTESALDRERRIIRERRAAAKAKATGQEIPSRNSLVMEIERKMEEDMRKQKERAAEMKKMREKQAMEKAEIALLSKMKVALKKEAVVGTEKKNENKVETNNAKLEQGGLIWPELAKEKAEEEAEKKDDEEDDKRGKPPTKPRVFSFV